MNLSVVIVNYNVKYFLKQCLESVYGSERVLKDGSTVELDVWVVDNDSVDGSVEMVRKDFPQVHVIENHENVGFAKANNMALACAAGQCLLLLNPDTVVEKDTLVRCADFMLAHPECGGLTVKMVDGDGNFLKESKRGFPSPQASFYKISGLIRLFPHSRRFAAYYMGHLPEDETNEIAKIYQKDRTLGQSLTALKVMMSTKGLCEPWMLMPLTRLSAEEENVIKKKIQ